MQSPAAFFFQPRALVHCGGCCARVACQRANRTFFEPAITTQMLMCACLLRANVGRPNDYKKSTDNASFIVFVPPTQAVRHILSASLCLVWSVHHLTPLSSAWFLVESPHRFARPACARPACARPACARPACARPACARPACARPACATHSTVCFSSAWLGLHTRARAVTWSDLV